MTSRRQESLQYVSDAEESNFVRYCACGTLLSAKVEAFLGPVTFKYKFKGKWADFKSEKLCSEAEMNLSKIHALIESVLNKDDVLWSSRRENITYNAY